MPGRTEIANMALGHFGQSRITDIGQSSPAAEAIRDCWDIARDAVLRSHTWNFASAREVLTPLADAPLFEWSVQYQLPSDYRRLISVNGYLAGTRDCPFVVEGRMLLTDESEAQIKYVRNVTDTEMWDSEFVLAFTFQLAEMVAPRITTDGGHAAMIASRKIDAGLSAMVSNATETLPLVKRAESGSAYFLARQGLHPDIG